MRRFPSAHGAKEEDEKGDFSPSPTRKRKSQLFQCTCGWTLVRTKPREGKSET